MKKINKLAMFVIVGFLSSAVLAGSWYEGGTLHKSKVSSWKASTYENKLATSADWVLQSPSIKSVVQSSSNINTAKKYAIELVSCIDTVIDGVNLAGGTSEVAANCMVLMGWLK